jgi:hypothetical protein
LNQIAGLEGSFKHLAHLQFFMDLFFSFLIRIMARLKGIFANPPEAG